MRLIIAALLSLLYISNANALCFLKDLECLAPVLLPGYDPDGESVREWSSLTGRAVARDNRIEVELRFDEEALSILRNGKPYGIEIEAVIKGENYNQVSLNYIDHNFTDSSMHAGQDTQVLDRWTNDANTKVFALHVLNAAAIEVNTDYYVTFHLNNPIPTGGVTVLANLQLTIDVDYDWLLYHVSIVDAFPVLNQFQHYALETDGHEEFKAYSDKYQGTCWDNKKNSYHCPGSSPPPSGTLAVSMSSSDAPLVSSASSVQSNYGGYTAPTGTAPQPILGPRVDLEPDFDVYDIAGNEISANCTGCSGKPVDVGQAVRAKLKTQVSNANADGFKRSSSSNTIEGPVWWMIEGKTGWNLLASGEYTISNLDKGKETVESHDWTVPNYPGDILAMKACVDGDDEIYEEGEGSGSGSDIDSPDQGGTTNNCSRRERFLIKHPNYAPTGAIESANCSLITGWTKDQNTPSSLVVRIYSSNPDGSNMQPLESAVASVERSDIGGRYGMEWMIPDFLIDGVARSLHFYAVNIPEGTNPLIGSVPLTCLPKTSSELSAEESAIWLILQP